MVLSFLDSATANVPFTTAVNGHVFVPPTSPPQVRAETDRQTDEQPNKRTDGHTCISCIVLFKTLTKFLVLKIYPKQENTTISCESLNCTDHCKCTYIVKLEKDKTVQIVFLNMGKVNSMIYNE